MVSGTLRPVSAALTLLAACLLSACATTPPPKAAPTKDPIVVTYTKGELSGWSELPMGAYRVPNSQVVVSGHQKGSAVPVLLFGLIGMAVESSVQTGQGKTATQPSEGSLHVTLYEQAQQDLADLLQEPEFSGRYTSTADPKARALAVSGNILLQFTNDTDVRPYVILRAELTGGAHGGSSWSGHYAASIGASRALSGPNSWSSDNGEQLKLVIAAELKRALAVMLIDVATPFPRDDSQAVAVEGDFPFMKKRLQMVGNLLTQGPDWIAFSGHMPSTSLLSGVCIMDKGYTTVRPATKDDPRAKVVASDK